MNIGPIPPWIAQSADPASFYARGLQLGMSGGEAQYRHQAQSQEMALNAARMAIANAQQREEMALRRQEVEARLKDNERQYAAQDQYANLVKGGMDPMEALLQVGPTVGPGATGFAAAYKQWMPKAPPSVMNIDVNGKKIPYIWNTETGSGEFPPNALVKAPPSEAPSAAQEVLNQKGEETGSYRWIDSAGNEHLIAGYPRPQQPGSVSQQENKQIQQLTDELKGFNNNTPTSLMYQFWKKGGMKPDANGAAMFREMLARENAVRKALNKLTGVEDLVGGSSTAVPSAVPGRAKGPLPPGWSIEPQ